MTSPTRPGTDSGTPYSPRTDGAAPQPAEKASIVEDFIEIFYAPSNVFARRRNAGFGLQFLIVTALSAVFAFASRSLFAAAFDADWPRMAAKMSAQNPQLTEEMIAAQRGIIQGVGTIFGYAGTPVFILVVAVLVWLFARIVSAKLSYGQAALIVTLAWIPRLLQGLFNTVQALITDPTTVQGAHSITASPARFMSGDESRMLLGALMRFDVFTIWVTVLIAIGIAVIGKVPRSQAAIAAALTWAVASVPFLFQ